MRTLLCLFAFCTAFLPVSAKLLKDSTETKTIITLPKYYPPAKVITGDTLGSPQFFKRQHYPSGFRQRQVHAIPGQLIRPRATPWNSRYPPF